MPDFFVSLESNGQRRQIYKLWEERKAPDFVLDVAATAGDGDRDWRGKPDGYAAIGVPEYWRFDPTGTHIAPRLQGFRRQADGYAALPAHREGAAITIRSEALDLDLHFDGERLRLRDSQTGRVFPAGQEFLADAVAAEAAYYAELDALREADAKLEAETRALREAEARVARAEQQLLARGVTPLTKPYDSDPPTRQPASSSFD